MVTKTSAGSAGSTGSAGTTDGKPKSTVKDFWKSTKKTCFENRAKLGFVLGVVCLYGVEAGVSLYQTRKGHGGMTSPSM